jgi:hypothetical protein
MISGNARSMLQPRIVGDFLRRYDASRFRPRKIGRNVLETMGVPSDARIGLSSSSSAVPGRSGFCARSRAMSTCTLARPRDSHRLLPPLMTTQPWTRRRTRPRKRATRPRSRHRALSQPALRQRPSSKVPDKVLDDMRSCGAAVIHVGTEPRRLDQDGKEHRVLNPNVLIEIGAAMMHYGRTSHSWSSKEPRCRRTLRGRRARP